MNIPIINNKPIIGATIPITPNNIYPNKYKPHKIQKTAATIINAAPISCNKKPFIINKKVKIKPTIRKDIRIGTALFFNTLIQFTPLFNIYNYPDL